PPPARPVGMSAPCRARRGARRPRRNVLPPAEPPPRLWRQTSRYTRRPPPQAEDLALTPDRPSLVSPDLAVYATTAASGGRSRAHTGPPLACVARSRGVRDDSRLRRKG